MTSVFHLKVKGSSLPKYGLFHTPNCYVLIKTDCGHAFATDTVTGSDPEWNQCFEIPLEHSSIISVHLFHVRSSKEEVPWGSVSIPLRDSLPRGQETIVLNHKLNQFGIKFHKRGSVVVSICRKPMQQPSKVSADNMGPNTADMLPTAVVEDASHRVEGLKRAEDDALAELERAKTVVTKLRGYDGTIMENAMGVTSSDPFTTVLGYLEKLVEFGDVISQVHPYATMAWKVLTAAHKAMQGQSVRDEKIEKLLVTISDMLAFMEETDVIVKIKVLQPTIASMMEEIRKCALFIQEYGRPGLGKRMMRDSLSTLTDHRIGEFVVTFNDLKDKFDRGIIIETFKILGDVHATDVDKVLENLPGRDLIGVKFNESRACLAGTRQQILHEIDAWVHSPDENCILWLSGGAGTGKTSVANSIAVSFDAFGCLGASFFFNRDVSGLNSPDYLFGNICYQLAHFGDHGQFPLKSTILAAVRSMGYVASSSLWTQARKLIIDIMNAVKFMGPIVIVIDALDESGTIPVRKELLDVISAELHKLPRSVKVMITSRDEPDIRSSLQDCSKEICIDHAERTGEDIASYIQHRLVKIQRHFHLYEDWPGLEKVQELVKCAGHLFIWASVACNFIEERRNPTGRLHRLLDATSSVVDMEGSPLEKLDLLYNSILVNAFPDEDDPLADFHYIVGSIIILEVPLTQSGLDFLLGIHKGSEMQPLALQDGHEIYLSSSEEIISPLWSILRPDPTAHMGKEGQLRLLHPSLYEFLTSHANGHFQINPEKQHEILAIRCLTTMNNHLKFDICKIGNTCVLNKEIEDLSERVHEHISEGLQYACCSFGYHVAKVLDPKPILIEKLWKFISEHLLHWIETMSLLGEITKAEICLHSISTWTKEKGYEGHNIEESVQDGLSFLQHCGQASRLAALHTYASGLALTPKKSSLSRSYMDHFPHTANIMSSFPMWPRISVRVMEGHADTVLHIVFSPDGQKLASSSGDCTIRLWDAGSGQPIGQALEGHTAFVSHVAFSPDGQRLASASHDSTVMLWDVESDHPIGQVLHGHIGCVNHVIFSPDGKKLASTSHDTTLRLWNVGSDKPIGQALQGHAKCVRYAVFSPDGQTLASASEDNTVRLWDVESCQPIGQALQGHTKDAVCVVFSPNGQKLASASEDNTVRLWDAESGQPIGQALQGHIAQVNHVAFSPDGKTLASASSDNTVRFWNSESGQPIGQALQGHTELVRHIVFSPDGQKLASASLDTTVRLWDVESGQPIGQALEGHTDCVNHVVFSPDCQKLASASQDNTVRLWNTEIHQPIGQALESHTAQINHVQFSPNGQKLASASQDKTVRLWDVKSGQPIGQALEGHTEPLIHVEFSPDGQKLASASHDMTVILWDVESDHPLDGQKLASASFDTTVRLWNVESGQPIGKVLEGHAECVSHVVFSPDGQKLASASWDNTVRLWNIETHQAIGQALIGHTAEVHHVSFSPDGQKLVSAAKDKTVRLWNVESGQPIGQALDSHSAPVTKLVFSPDGHKFASSSYDTTVRLWNAQSGQPIGQILEGHTEFVNDVVFSPDGQKLASASPDHTVRLWNAETGHPIEEALEGHIDHVVFSPDGQKLASASHDGAVGLWDVESGMLIWQAPEGHTQCVHHVVFSPEGQKLASASHDMTVKLWNVESGQQIGSALEGHGECVYHAVFSPDGQRLASASDDITMRLWDANNGQQIGKALKGHSDLVNHVVFSPDGQKLASASQDNTVRLWNAETGQPIAKALEGHTAQVYQVVFSPDGQKLSSASLDTTVRVWDAESGQLIRQHLQGLPEDSQHVVLSPDGQKLASASTDNTVRLWDVESGQPIGHALQGHTESFKHVVFSTDGQKLVSVTADKIMRIWDVETRKPITYAHDAPTDSAIQVMFSLDAHKLALQPGLTSLTHFINFSFPDMKGLLSEFPDTLMEMTMFFDQLGFLHCGAGRLVWLPAMLRGRHIALLTQSSTIAVGGGSGAITIIRFPSSVGSL